MEKVTNYQNLFSVNYSNFNLDLKNDPRQALRPTS